MRQGRAIAWLSCATAASLAATGCNAVVSLGSDGDAGTDGGPGSTVTDFACLVTPDAGVTELFIIRESIDATGRMVRRVVRLHSTPYTSAVPIATPAGWGVELPYANCSCQPGSVAAITGTGTISSLDDAGAVPSALSVDVTLTFPSGYDWLGVSERIVRDPLPVTPPRSCPF